MNTVGVKLDLALEARSGADVPRTRRKIAHREAIDRISVANDAAIVDDRVQGRRRRVRRLVRTHPTSKPPA